MAPRQQASAGTGAEPPALPDRVLVPVGIEAALLAGDIVVEADATGFHRDALAAMQDAVALVRQVAPAGGPLLPLAFHQGARGRSRPASAPDALGVALAQVQAAIRCGDARQAATATWHLAGLVAGGYAASWRRFAASGLKASAKATDRQRRRRAKMLPIRQQAAILAALGAKHQLLDQAPVLELAAAEVARIEGLGGKLSGDGLRQRLYRAGVRRGKVCDSDLPSRAGGRRLG